MVEVKDIVDQESLEAWGAGRPQFEIDAVINRAALRVLPFFLHWAFIEFEEKQYIMNPITFLWQSLFSYAFANCPPVHKSVPVPDFVESVRHKKNNSGNRTRIRGIYTISDAAYYSEAAAYSLNALPSDMTFPMLAMEHATKSGMWESVHSDCEDLKNAGSLHGKSLWGEEVNPLQNIWAETKAALAKDKEDWSFWIKWYDSILEGQPLSCEMLFNILRISQNDWKKEAGHISGLIAKIEEEFLIAATPIAEKIELAPATQRLRIVPERMSQKALYSNLLEVIQDGITDLRDSPQFDNALSALGPVFEKVLDRTFDKYLSSPQRVHDDFVKAKRRIQKLLDVGEVASNDEVIEFVDDLDAGAAHIRANMPQVRDSMAALAALRIAEASDADIEGISAGAEAIAAQSEPEMAEEMREDAAELVASRHVPMGAPKVFAPDVAYRLGHRIVESKQVLTKVNVEKAGTVSTATFTGSQMIIEAVRVILRLFGV